MGVLTVLAECEIKGNDEAKGPQTSAKKPRETKTTNSKPPVNRRVLHHAAAIQHLRV